MSTLQDKLNKIKGTIVFTSGRKGKNPERFTDSSSITKVLVKIAEKEMELKSYHSKNNVTTNIFTTFQLEFRELKSKFGYRSIQSLKE